LETEYLIGQLWEELGKYPEAETTHRRVWNHRVKLFGEEHQETMASLDELAGVLGCQGNFEDAERIQRHVVEGYEKNCPQDHERLSIGLNNLGHLLHLQDNLDEAEDYYRRSLKPLRAFLEEVSRKLSRLSTTWVHY
jgi:tetratricopeptide (TPR) repeat protein